VWPFYVTTSLGGVIIQGESFLSIGPRGGLAIAFLRTIWPRDPTSYKSHLFTIPPRSEPTGTPITGIPDGRRAVRGLGGMASNAGSAIPAPEVGPLVLDIAWPRDARHGFVPVAGHNAPGNAVLPYFDLPNGS